MNRLIAELQRLYFFPDQLAPEALAFDLVGPDGRVRAMAVGFARSADWETVAELYRAVQEDLDLPAPAISVSGKAGFDVWFSLAEAVPVEEAGGFLNALRRKYLAEIPVAQLRFQPDGGLIERVPALDPASGKWSAFIDPAMVSMFAEEPGLEMAPNLDRQADLLAGFASTKAGDFQRALKLLVSPVRPGDDAGKADRPRSTLSLGSNFSDPKSFLLAVMNDPSASADQRIKAAKALLPYFEKADPK